MDVRAFDNRDFSIIFLMNNMCFDLKVKNYFFSEDPNFHIY